MLKSVSTLMWPYEPCTWFNTGLLGHVDNLSCTIPSQLVSYIYNTIIVYHYQSLIAKTQVDISSIGQAMSEKPPLTSLVVV